MIYFHHVREELMNDLISRQAIKELAHNQVREKYCGVALKEKRDFYIKLADSIIDLLPTIQPEIVKCKDCEHGVLDDGFPHQYFCVFKGDEWNNTDYFCGHAKRREVTT